MSIRSMTLYTTLGLAVGLLTVALSAGQQTSTPMMGHDMPMARGDATRPGGMTMSTADKIANAMTAAPAVVSAKAAVLDWPATEGGAPVVLRQGQNGWSCFPDMPLTNGNDPMCLDGTWLKWMEAYLAQKAPEITRVGIGYMMAPGGAWGSNTDPFAMKETADNHWGHHSPHMMIVVPDPKSLAGLSTNPSGGGPYVMWAGTPYVHVMAPTAALMTMPSGAMPAR